jgi:hypothetical protein
MHGKTTIKIVSEIFLLLRIIQRDKIINVQYIAIHVNYLLFLLDFDENLFFGLFF